MNPAVAPLAAILDPNTDLLLNCLDGLSEAEARLTPLLADTRGPGPRRPPGGLRS